MGHITVEATAGGCPIDYEKYGDGPFPICGYETNSKEEKSTWFVRIRRHTNNSHRRSPVLSGPGLPPPPATGSKS